MPDPSHVEHFQLGPVLGQTQVLSKTWANIKKLFTEVICEHNQETRVFVPGNHLQPNLMVVGKATSQPKSASGASLG
jgi:hypothetical protein